MYNGAAKAYLDKDVLSQTIQHMLFLHIVVWNSIYFFLDRLKHIYSMCMLRGFDVKMYDSLTSVERLTVLVLNRFTAYGGGRKL